MRIPNWPPIPQTRNINSSLMPMRHLLAELGNPHLKLPPTIHIAGTNGKGSSLAFFKQIYETAGYKVHCYSSPHLLEFNERIYLAGSNISDDHIKVEMDRIKAASEKIGHCPSFFEATTALAFLAFSAIKADILIMETGLGGACDPTNVIENPYLTLITPISYDHQEYLGSSIEEIAKQKAGIIKPSSPCVVSAQDSKALEVILNEAQQKNAPCFCYEYDFGIELTNDGFKYLSKQNSIELPKPSLVGYHQYINSAAVIAGILALNNLLPVNIIDIKNALQNTKWPGRIEEIPFSNRQFISLANHRLYLDGAHNEAGAQSLSEWAKNLEEPVILILGMTKKRNPKKFMSHFQGVKEIVTVTVESEPNSYGSTELAKTISKDSKINVCSQYSLQQAFDYIKNKYEPVNINIIITGSLFLLADFYKIR